MTTSTRGLITLPTAGPGKNLYAEVHADCMPIQTGDPPLRSGLLSSSARAAALSKNRAHCLNCHEDSHSLRQCRHPFQNLSGISHPDLGKLGDDGAAFRRWQERMTRHRREYNPRPKKHNQTKTGVVPAIHEGSITARVRRKDKVMATIHTRNNDTNSQTTAITVSVRPPLPLPSQLPAWGLATVLRITRTVTPTNASQAPSAPVTDRSTPVRLLLPARRQHCQEKTH